MRLFFALLPDAAASKRLAEVAAGLDLRTSRPVPAENYHVTLTFIGDIEDSALSSLRKLGEALTAFRGAVSFCKCEFWPHSRVLVVAGDAISPAIVDFVDRLQFLVASHRTSNAMEHCWKPHVTLARNVSQAPVLQAMSPIGWIASSFALMSSERRDGRSVYTVVDTYPLLDKI